MFMAIKPKMMDMLKYFKYSEILVGYLDTDYGYRNA